MTPLSHTLYSVALFFALLSLMSWLKRRRRVSEHRASGNRPHGAAE